MLKLRVAFRKSANAPEKRVQHIQCPVLLRVTFIISLLIKLNDMISFNCLQVTSLFSLDDHLTVTTVHTHTHTHTHTYS